MHPSLLIQVTDQSQAGEARREARVWAREDGGDEDHVARVALVITELANNLDLHTTRGGVLLLRKVNGEGQTGVEILSLDHGPGTANFSQFMRDGFSTTGTPGTGLGAVERGSQVFEVYSQPTVGTTLLSQIWPRRAKSEEERWQVGAVNLPMRHETVSGDSWCFYEGTGGGRSRLIIADGLGHGPVAAEASRRAVETFDAHKEQPLPTLLGTLHTALRGTRGAAVAIAEVDLASETLRYVGVGNIAGVVLTHEKSTSLVSMNGTVGVRCEKIQEFSYPWPAGGLLIMSSDGLKTQWNLNRYHGLLSRHPGLIAGTLYRDYNRGTDDTTVAAIRAVK